MAPQVQESISLLRYELKERWEGYAVKYVAI
jgi:hypothetical protein